jgi:Tfp pilus assembly protein PilF
MSRFPTEPWARITNAASFVLLFGMKLACILLVAQLSRASQTPGTSTAQTASPSAAALAAGMKLLQDHDLAGAENSFDKAVKLDPQNAAARNMLGWVLLAQSKLDPAIAQFHAALAIKPSHCCKNATPRRQ